MQHDTPSLSIGMPVYNAGPFLAGSIESLLAQSHTDFELILVDNDSTDDTSSICLEFEQEDPRIRYIKNRRNVGSRRNYNLAHELARGEFFMWARAHDLWDRTLLARCIDVLESDPGVVLCHARCTAIDGEGANIRDVGESIDTRGMGFEERLHEVWAHAVGPAALGVVRRDAMDRTRRFREITGCDIVFLVELSTQGAFAFLGGPVLSLRSIRSETSEEETLLRTRLQMNPFADQYRRPLETHMLDFCRMHLEIIEDLQVNDGVRQRLQADLIATYSTKFAGSLERVSSRLAEHVLERFGADTKREFVLSFEAIATLEQVHLGLLFRPQDSLLLDAQAILLAYLGTMER